MTIKCNKARVRPFFLLVAGVIATATGLASGEVIAQVFPSRTVRIVVGFPPGGAVDANARLLASRMGEFLGQPVIVDNRPGAVGQIAAEHVAKSAPDGHTILLTTVGHAIAPSLYRKLPFDPIADFSNVTQTTAASMILVVNSKVPANNLTEFVKLAAAKPGRLNYGTTGASDPLGLAMEVLRFTSGMDIVAIQYKGAGPIYTALLAGEVDIAFMPTSLSIGHLNSGRLRALATGSPQRIGLLPAVPTVAESGYPGFDATNWQGMFAPARTPAEIVRKIQSAVAMTMAIPEIRERFSAAGQDTIASTPEEFDAKVKADAAKFAKIVKDAKIPMLD